VLVGDFLYSRAFQMMVSVGHMRVLQVLAEATNVIAEGEVLQLMNMHDPDLAVEEYLRVIRSKTAKLFEASARLGAILAGADAATEEACAGYGRRWARHSSSSTICSTTTARPGNWARTSATICAKAKPTLPLARGDEDGAMTPSEP
jgi:octaprenyl-diphosphate synthase